jgi:hypothetical protein
MDAMNPDRTSWVYVALIAIIGGGVIDATSSKGPPGKTDVTLTFQRFVDVNGLQHAELTMSNRTSLPLWFTGYSASEPAYDIQYSKGNRWEDSRDSRRAKGLERFELRSLQNATFRVPLGLDDRMKQGMRVSVVCSREEEYRAGVGRIYRSEKITQPK